MNREQILAKGIIEQRYQNGEILVRIREGYIQIGGLKTILPFDSVICAQKDIPQEGRICVVISENQVSFIPYESKKNDLKNVYRIMELIVNILYDNKYSERSEGDPEIWKFRDYWSARAEKNTASLKE
jgi:hypothetical protein